ncbi:DNA repair protein [Rhodofomes roseus]|uniref:DNA repair protein n=1 Tax=Rhodofomes roseus TaxID=34475 RepID=A0ABQ8KVB0_9APHY|nr:DNA repair protein [Rhodofomes roseus]KAH9842469.1 DNA repair protein [Rhodofomes roseus]
MSTQGTASSDYYDNDPEFLKALNEAVIDIDDQQTAPSRRTPPPTERPTPARLPSSKRARTPDSDEEGVNYHGVLGSVGAGGHNTTYLDSHTYGAARFGEFGEYMARKRAKLQVQNAEMDTDEADATLRIFKGLQIYINGWTEPSVQDLRELIIKHGGIYHPYLDKKGLVTHIITCSLTPAKVREFKHMRVVRPEWLVESAEAGQLLPWQDHIFRAGERVEASQGRKVGQRSLFDGFASQAVDATRKPGPSAAMQPVSAFVADAQPVAGPSRIADAVTPPSTPPRTPKSKRNEESPRPLSTSDPSTPEQASRVPGYAAHKSNIAAQRAMADPAWRAAHTSVAPNFIEGYYKNSRLHHLSAWKAELKNLVAEAQERIEDGTASTWGRMPDGDESAVSKIIHENIGGKVKSGGDVSMKGAQLVMRSPRGKGKPKATDDEERVIMHCDFDSFFVSAGLLDRPHLRGKPVVVCHSQGNQGGAPSTSEIASASYEARDFGIRSGMSLQQARKLCPTLMTVPYEFQRYKQLSLQFYTILMAHADDLQAVSVDEALIDVTSSVDRINTELAHSQDSNSSLVDPAKDFAEAIRAQVRKVTGCEVSIGIAHNIMLARVASRRAKPAGSFHIFPHNAQELLAPLDIDDLHGFGSSAHQKALEKLGATTLGELAKRSKATLCEALGKGTGETLYNVIRGIDHRRLESDKPRKSVSCDINYGIRFENNSQTEAFIFQMAEEVARRLDNIDMRGRSLMLKILKRDPSAPVEAPKFMGHGICESFNRQTPLIAPGGHATSDAKVIGEHASRLLKGFNFDPKELRGISIQIQKLEKGPAATVSGSGQAVLPFKAKPTRAAVEPDPTSSKSQAKRDVQAAGPSIVVEPPSQDEEIQIVERPPKLIGATVAVDLPSFSQVDMSVFDALPDDVRKELETEYNRRSTTPAAEAGPSRSRSASIAEEQKLKITVKGTNVKHITRQLAPRNRTGMSPTKSTLFAKRDGPSGINVSERDLRKLDIDPEVFVMLPADVQREQLAAARIAKAPGAAVFHERKVLKPKSRSKSQSVPYYRPPAPRAKYIEPPFLKQQGKDEKLYFTEKEDVQRVIETWVDGFREYPPNQRDVDYFAKYLVQCVDGLGLSDAGIEKAVAVARWWLVLLRRRYGVWEHASEATEDSAGRVTTEVVGRAWWKAFREVKAKMDVAARKKYGGSLSIR